MGTGWRRGWKGIGALAALALLPRCEGGVDAGAGDEASQPAPSFIGAPPAAPSRVHTFSAVEDGTVDASRPDVGLGGDAALQVDAAPTEQRAFTRFEVTGLSGRVTRATLRLHAFSGTADGPAVYRTQGPWTEASLTFHHQPWREPFPEVTLLDDAGAIASGTWVELDVTRAVAGNGVHDFGLYATGTDGVDFDSRESAHVDRRPQLVVETDGSPPPPPDGCVPVTRIFHPLADESARADTPDTPNGLGPLLLVDASPVRYESFLHFDLSGSLPGPVASAKLRLFVANGSVDGPALYHAGGASWHWSQLTWSRRPVAQGLLADLGEVPANQWVELDVTEAVKQGEDFTFALVPTSEDGVDFHSTGSASGELTPRLAVTFASTGCRHRGTGGAIGWTRQHGGTGGEAVRAMATAEDGTSFVVAGGFTGSGDFGGARFTGERGLVVARYAQDGSHQWSRAYAPGARAEVTGLSVTASGHILLVGEYRGALDLGTGVLPSIEESPGLFVARLSPQGEPLWAHGFHPELRSPGEPVRTGIASARAVGTDFMGSLIVTGVFYGRLNLGGGELYAGPMSEAPYDASPGLFLARFHPEGRHVWSIAFPGGDSGSVPHALATDSQGFIYVGGATASHLLGATAPGTPFITKFSWNGTPQWHRALHGAEGTIRALSVVPGGVGFAGDFNGTFSFGGEVLTSQDAFPGIGPSDAVFGVLRASGHDGWVRAVGGGATEQAYALGADTAGNLVVAGWTLMDRLELGGGVLSDAPLAPGAYRHFVARYGPDGTHRWSRLLGPKSFDSVAVQVAPDGRTRLGSTFEGNFDPGSGDVRSRGARDALFLQLAP